MCTNCNNDSGSVSVFDVQYIYNSNCTNCNADCNGSVSDSKCVGYFGPNLSCSGIVTNDSLELALQKIDEKLCETAGDYSTYNIHCIPGPITTEASFVSAITLYTCNLNDAFEEFTETTYIAYQNTVDLRFDAIEVPGITCASASVTNTNTLNQILTKYCTKFGAIDAAISLVGVDWDQCFTVPTPPTTIAGGFNLVIDQICAINELVGDGASLPTFNNVGSCLASPGASDSLVDTVNKIRTRLCLSPTFTNSGLVTSCVTLGSGTDLQTLIQNMLAKLDAVIKASPTFDNGDFDVTNVDDDNLCLGKNITLATPLNQDRYVASNDDDTSPGTLADKLEEGDNISLDFTTTPGKVIITSEGGDGDHTVAADSTDDEPDYLDEKIEGQEGNNGVSVETSYNPTSKKVDIIPSLDMGVFFESFIEYLNDNPDQKTVFCQMMAECPSPCAQPENASAVYISGGITTTTTTLLP